MPGTLVRTNYRRTGAVLDITAIGGGIPLASIHGGAGTQLPYGGAILYSFADTIAEATAAASLAGISSRWVQSAYGIMSAFYGSTMFISGYKFQPLAVYFISVTGLNISAGQWGNSFLPPIALSLRTSGSIAIFTPLLPLIATASQVSFVSLSGATMAAQIFGFIISGPTS